jgi:hypothetical protein
MASPINTDPDELPLNANVMDGPARRSSDHAARGEWPAPRRAAELAVVLEMHRGVRGVAGCAARRRARSRTRRPAKNRSRGSGSIGNDVRHRDVWNWQKNSEKVVDLLATRH